MAAVAIVRDAAPRAWIEVGGVEDVPRAGARRVCIGDRELALVRTPDGALFAIDNRCPHRGGPLAEGIVTDCHIVCPLHEWVMRLADGCAEPPDAGRVRTYPVRVEDGVVRIGIPAPR